MSIPSCYRCINKNNPDSKNYIYGNALYEMMLRHVISDVISLRPFNDLIIYVDRSRFIKEEDLKSIARFEASKYGANVLDCGKRDSHQTPCIQVVDFVAGATRAKYENDDLTISIIDYKISIARRY